MHLPEFALCGGCFRGLGSPQRVWVNLKQGEMAVHETHPAQQFVKHLFSRAMSALTSRALVVSVCDHSNVGIRRADHEVMFINRNCQREPFCFDHLLSPLKDAASRLVYFLTKVIFVPYMRPTPL